MNEAVPADLRRTSSLTKRRLTLVPNRIGTERSREDQLLSAKPSLPQVSGISVGNFFSATETPRDAEAAAPPPSTPTPSPSPAHAKLAANPSPPSPPTWASADPPSTAPSPPTQPTDGAESKGHSTERGQEPSPSIAQSYFALGRTDPSGGLYGSLRAASARSGRPPVIM